MTWFKVDDNLATHSKVLIAGNEALGLWVRCGSWSAQQLTDGFVPGTIVQLFGSLELASRLVTSGLWVEAGDGFIFKDWQDFQPTRTQVLAEREAARERQRKAREKRSPANVTSEVDAATGEVLEMPKRGRATRIPDGFALTDEMTAWVRKNTPGVDPVLATAKFVDYWAAKSGANATKTDWVATWRNWCRRENEWANPEATKNLVELEQARADREKRLEQGRAQRAEMEAARLKATPPPNCEHGKSLMKCLPCMKALAESESK